MDFYDFEGLYKKGQSYDKFFGDSRLHGIDISKISIQKIGVGGRTALGPALALAMGMLSMHDRGSRIVVATDSLPNFGLLSQGDKSEVYNRMGDILKENGATLGMLRWTDGDGKGEEESWGEFRRRFKDHVNTIEVNLANCKDSQGLDVSMLSLRNLINLEPVGDPCKVKVYCDNPKVVPSKLNNDLSDYSSLRFLNSNSKCWAQLSIRKE
ncbi:unnamed protein product [Sphagnum balticum]